MSWMWGAAMTAMMWFLIMVLVLGAAVFRSRHWNAAFREIAVWEAQRRGLADRKWSSADEKAVGLMIGPEPMGPEGTGPQLESLLLPTFWVLSGDGDSRRDLAMTVVDKREVLLDSALRRQLRTAARFSTLRWAARAWVIQKWLSRVEVATRGVAWLLPRSINEITAIVKEYSTKLGVVAVFAGAVYWILVVKNEQGAGASAPDVIGVLAKLVLPGLVLWAMGVLLFRILVAVAGPPQKWSRRAVLTAGVVAMMSAGAAVAMDAASKALGPLERQWLDQVDANDPTVLRVSAAFFSMGFLWMAWKLAPRTVDRTRPMSDRIGVLGAGVMLLAFSIPMAGIIATGAVPGPLRAMMFAMFAVSIVLSLVSSACAVREWIDRYLRLTRSGVKVPRWGFSWWLIGVWILAMGMLFVQAALPIGVQNSPFGLALVVPPTLAMLGMIPMALISVLFVRRVNTYYERHMAVPWPEL